MTALVVGADVGGTSTRVAVASLDGTVLALARGGPGNPNSVGVAGSATEIRAATERALSRVEASEVDRSVVSRTGVDKAVAAVVIGLAGGSRAAAEPGFLRSAVPVTVAVLPALVSDLTVAFCSATPAASGSVLVAGTGAVSGRVVGSDLVEQRDGWGWLLGDEGSGFWIGRAAARVALADLQLGRPPGPLARAVLAQARAESYLDLLQACYAEPPTGLARFAPLVSRHAAGDPVAAAIAHQAAGQLEALLSGLSLVPGEPVVLAGSVLTSDGPVQSLLRERLRGRGLGPVVSPASGVIGALWIALRGCGVPGPDVHVRLVQTTRRLLDGQEAAEKFGR